MTTTRTTEQPAPPPHPGPQRSPDDASAGGNEAWLRQPCRHTRRVWSQEVLVRSAVLQARLDAMRLDRKLSAGEAKLAERAADRLTDAGLAATRVHPARSIRSWWRGTHVDAA